MIIFFVVAIIGIIILMTFKALNNNCVESMTQIMKIRIKYENKEITQEQYLEEIDRVILKYISKKK